MIRWTRPLHRSRRALGVVRQREEPRPFIELRPCQPASTGGPRRCAVDPPLVVPSPPRSESWIPGSRSFRRGRAPRVLPQQSPAVHESRRPLPRLSSRSSGPGADGHTRAGRLMSRCRLARAEQTAHQHQVARRGVLSWSSGPVPDVWERASPRCPVLEKQIRRGETHDSPGVGGGRRGEMPNTPWRIMRLTCLGAGSPCRHAQRAVADRLGGCCVLEAGRSQRVGVPSR